MDNMTAELTPRRRAILGLVIRSFIESALPVGSKTFVEGYGLDVSPATIRNEMASLETLGFLTHRHTSAGRVPTEVGYRFFVEHLLGGTELPLSEKHMIRHQFHQARLELDQWARLAAAILAHSTRKAAVATPPRSREARIKHLELISVRDSLVLLVLVLDGGALKQEMLVLQSPQDQAALSRLSNELNELLAGQTSEDIRKLVSTLPLVGQEISRVILGQMGQAEERCEEELYREGLAHILAEPEFSEGDQVREMVKVLEGPLLVEMIATATQPLEVGGVQVLIGGEGRWSSFNELSVVLSRYGVQGGATGLLGIVGPIRMPYDRTIGAVRYVSQLMTDLVSDWYGGQLEAGGNSLD
jgi:heat-inducible transcriptional repressor